MATVVGIELCDTGVCTVATQGDEDSRPLRLEGDTTVSPACVYWDGASFVGGQAAEAVARIHPRYVSDNVWEWLSLKPSDLARRDTVPSFSKLAYHYLKYIWERIQKLAGTVDKVSFAVSGDYFQPMAEGEQKIGLLLGIASDLNLPLVAIVDNACTTLLTSWNQEQAFVYIDLDQHRSLVQRCAVGDHLEQQEQLLLPHLGYAQLREQLAKQLAHQLLQQTAFDVTEDTRLEQVFFQKIKAVFTALERQKETRLEIEWAGRPRQISVVRDEVSQALSHFIDSLLKGLGRVTQDRALGVVLSPRAVQLPGLEASLRAREFRYRGLKGVHLAAQGAAGYAFDQPFVSNLEKVPLIESVRLDKLEQRAISGRNTGVGSQRLIPSHIVFEGCAHRLVFPQQGKGAVTILDGLELPFQFYWNGSALKLGPEIPEGLRLNGNPFVPETPLKAGDRLAFVTKGQLVMFLLITCMS